VLVRLVVYILPAVVCAHHSTLCNGIIVVVAAVLPGNLRAAVRMGRSSYELLLEPDTNTLGHTQWFFFRVRGMVDGVRYTFTISNLEKGASLFNEGMRPLMYVSLDRPRGPIFDDPRDSLSRSSGTTASVVLPPATPVVHVVGAC
jgi:hypothetical protein